MTYFVYILQSEVDGSFYIGQTQDIEARLIKHNKGYNRSTKNKRPWKVIKTFEVKDRKEAVKLERKLKSYKKREAILRIIDSGM